mgnify:CR=1 FL=1
MSRELPAKWDYVLATKCSDGDPGDQWCVGFYDRFENNRHYVIDQSGKQFRANGFGRVSKISKDRGKFILDNIRSIENEPSHSLWWWKRCKMASTPVIARG